ncbi:hypothetical protein [Streptomyces platensis]|nr:hypothetical protein OG962_01650 [Streptomyces platensis]
MEPLSLIAGPTDCSALLASMPFEPKETEGSPLGIVQVMPGLARADSRM